MADRPTLYILDAYSLIYQVFHAIPTMTGPAGQPTNAVFGIFRDLLNILRVRKPDYLAAAFEGGGADMRTELFAEYKANRAAMPEISARRSMSSAASSRASPSPSSRTRAPRPTTSSPPSPAGPPSGASTSSSAPPTRTPASSSTSTRGS